MFKVINERSDKVMGEWANLDDAETHAGELNAGYPNGDGPYMAVPEGAMRFAIVDMEAESESISAGWHRRDRAQDVADDLNREFNTQRYVVLPIEQQKASNAQRGVRSDAVAQWLCDSAGGGHAG